MSCVTELSLSRLIIPSGIEHKTLPWQINLAWKVKSGRNFRKVVGSLPANFENRVSFFCCFYCV